MQLPVNVEAGIHPGPSPGRKFDNSPPERAQFQMIVHLGSEAVACTVAPAAAAITFDHDAHPLIGYRPVRYHEK